MSTRKNVGFLSEDTSRQGMYYIYAIAYVEGAEENIPEDCTSVPFSDIQFPIRVGPKYYWNSVAFAVVRNSDQKPLYLVGDFYQK